MEGEGPAMAETAGPSSYLIVVSHLRLRLPSMILLVPLPIIVNDATPPQPVQRFSNPPIIFQRKPRPIPTTSDDQALDGTKSGIVPTSSHFFHQTLATT